MPYGLVWLVRATIGATLALAAIAKVKHFSSFSTTVAQVGIPSDRARIASSAYVLFESLVALACCVVRNDSAVALGIFLIGLSFFGASLYALARGRHIACSCFGDSSGDLDWISLGLGLVFIVTALLLYRAGPYEKNSAVVATMAFFLEAVLVALIVLKLRTGRRLQRSKLIPPAVSPGAPLPEISGLWAHTMRPVAMNDITLDVVLLFIDYRCHVCKKLAASHDFLERISAIIVLPGPAERSLEFIEENGIDRSRVIIDYERRTHDNFALRVTPILIEIRSGVIANVLSNFPEKLEFSEQKC